MVAVEGDPYCFSGGEITTLQSSFAFSKFVPVELNELLPILLSGYMIDDRPQFTLESLPSNDKDEYYEFIGTSLNPGKEPELFEVTVEVISGDETTIQTWDYGKCNISNYDIYLDNSLLNYKYHERWQSEIRDRIFSDCGGLKFTT